MNNIFEKKDVSFHGIRSLDFTKLKEILRYGILPGNLLPSSKRNTTVADISPNKVFVTQSPRILGLSIYKSRAYCWYIHSNIGIVIDKMPLGVDNKHAFPDAGYLEGAISPDLFLGITIPKSTYESIVGEIKDKRIILDSEVDKENSTVEQIIDIYNKNKIPIYDSETGELLKNYFLDDNHEVKRK